MTTLKQHLLDLAAGKVEPLDRSDGICDELCNRGYFPEDGSATEFVCDHLQKWPLLKSGHYHYPIEGIFAYNQSKDKWANPRRLEACAWLAERCE